MIFKIVSQFLLNRVEINRSKSGYILVSTLVFATIAVILLTALSGWAAVNYRAVTQTVDREKAFQIAEAGIEYYRWHLAHSPQDFQDGTATSGPYIHPYFDKMGAVSGSYQLTITPPAVGSTVVKIVSKGTTATTSVSRSIEAVLAIPSLSKYAFVSNSPMRFGEGTEVFGPIHDNEGIRFDGLAHNLVTSAKASYDDPDHPGGQEFGVHTHIQAPPSSGTSEGGLSSEAPPTSPVPSRTDVFIAGRQFPVPALDWTGFTQDLAVLKTLAQAGGYYFPGSATRGYNIILKTDGTFSLYKVTALADAKHSCNKPNWGDQEGWGTWSVKTQTLVGNYSLPANGVIFVEDNVWVEGKVNNARVTIASGRFPESVTTNTSISFTKDILYTNYDGRDVVALIAQNNINAGMESADTIEIDAALVAKNGRVGRYYYNASCDPYDDRTKIKLYGMIASSDRYGFAYTSNPGGGYATREIVYDGNLLYSPPPSFPLMGDQYQTISWREVQ